MPKVEAKQLDTSEGLSILDAMATYCEGWHEETSKSDRADGDGNPLTLKTSVKLEGGLSQVYRQLASLLHDGKLVAWSRAGRPDGKPTQLPSSAWAHLSLEPDIPDEWTVISPEGTKHYEVRIYEGGKEPKEPIPSGAAGRPSMMKAILRENQRRVGKGEARNMISAEGRDLIEWAGSQYGSSLLNIPELKTVTNKLSSLRGEGIKVISSTPK